MLKLRNTVIVFDQPMIKAFTMEHGGDETLWNPLQEVKHILFEHGDSLNILFLFSLNESRISSMQFLLSNL